jgi:Protein of unknown function (DUF2946)
VLRYRRGRLAQAIGWIVAYAFALQTILAGLIVVPQASNSAAAFDAAIFCLTSHGADNSDQIDPGGTHRSPHLNGHCGLCAVSAATIAPVDAVVVALMAPAPLLLLPVLAEAEASPSPDSLPGRPRAPPTTIA